jgi:hypothetical protein
MNHKIRKKKYFEKESKNDIYYSQASVILGKLILAIILRNFIFVKVRKKKTNLIKK